MHRAVAHHRLKTILLPNLLCPATKLPATAPVGAPTRQRLDAMRCHGHETTVISMRSILRCKIIKIGRVSNRTADALASQARNHEDMGRFSNLTPVVALTSSTQH
ncbi:uncharacterized protein [Lolium perenne]|uniref:uncharacterized protein n=1 Tax=Lolium perenne TaxID=4522 RepID=UPI003A9A34A5